MPAALATVVEAVMRRKGFVLMTRADRKQARPRFVHTALQIPHRESREQSSDSLRAFILNPNLEPRGISRNAPLGVSRLRAHQQASRRGFARRFQAHAPWKRKERAAPSLPSGGTRRIC